MEIYLKIMSVLNGGLPSDQIRTIFSTLPGYFPNAQEKIRTNEFLEAATGVVVLVEKFGKVFSPVIHDMNGNIKKISTKYDENKENFEYLEDMILQENSAGQILVVDALQWLRRGLDFISKFFTAIIEDSDSNTNTQDLSPFIKAAYRDTLERYHGWLGVQLFSILSRFAPRRNHFFYVLALEKHDREEHVLRDMRIFTQRMTTCIRKLIKFYEEHNLETHVRV